MQDQLTQKYLVSIWDKAQAIETLFWEYMDGDAKALETLRLHAHSLKGSGATFGFPSISEAGAELEQADDEELKKKLEALLQVISEVIVANKSEEAANEEIDDTAIDGRNKALIIDRSKSNTEVISRCIGQVDGIDECIKVSSGAEARNLYSKTRFDLIVLDLVLPDQDGREILREIKQMENFNSPVLVTSSVPGDGVYMECISIGADGYLSKPFDTDDLYSEGQKIVRLSRLEARQKPAPAPAPVEEEVETTSNLLKGQNILVVEDDEIQALFISEKLSKQGAEISVAGNGRLALEALEHNSYSVILMDGKMPEMDGFEALEAIRDNPRYAGLPVIMVTAMGSEDDIIRAYDLGANDYMLKPFSEEQLLKRINHLLDQAA